LFGVVVILGLFRCARFIHVGARASKGGYVLYGDGHEEIWERKSEEWGTWWRRLRGEEKEFEVLEVDDGTRKRGFFWWNNRSGGMASNGNAERTPLISS
jgi:hypothetical protein